MNNSNKATTSAAFDMDADAANDPELAMALRISLEENRARQQENVHQYEKALRGKSILYIPSELTGKQHIL